MRSEEEVRKEIAHVAKVYDYQPTALVAEMLLDIRETLEKIDQRLIDKLTQEGVYRD